MEAATPAPGPVAKSNKTVLMILGSIVVVLALGLIAYFATRTSAEEKALQAVCTARADVQQRVESLAATTVTNFTINGFKANVNGIATDLKTIKDNQAKLKPDRKQQIQQANNRFGSEVTNTLRSLGTSLSIDNAQEKLKTAGQQLIQSYKDTLGPVDCSGVDVGS